MTQHRQLRDAAPVECSGTFTMGWQRSSASNRRVPGPGAGAPHRCQTFFHSPATRGLDISGGDEKVDPNVTIRPIGNV